jgi:uncharacterized membrane protein (UPF0127 family)
MTRPALHRAAACLLTLMLACLPAAHAQQPPLPTVRLQAGLHLIEAEVARTPQQRQTGLMLRETMPPNHGMLFVFDEPAVQCFWMKNTLLPLSIAFIADDGTIVSLADMKPQTETNHCSAKPVRYALEMNQGWFARRGIKAGFRLGGFEAAR